MASTLLHSLHLPVPSNLEGRVATEVFTDEFLKKNPVVKGAPAQESDQHPPSSPGEQPVRTKEEEDAVYEQLRALGYVE